MKKLNHVCSDAKVALGIERGIFSTFEYSTDFWSASLQR